MGVTRRGGAGGSSELSFISIGFTLPNEVRARGCTPPPLDRMPPSPPAKFFGYTHGIYTETGGGGRFIKLNRLKSLKIVCNSV